MRSRPWRFLATTSLLFVSALTLQQCRSTPASQPADGQPAFKPVATVDQVMDGIIIPSSQAIFDAVVYSNGELVQSPKTDDDWYNLRIHAIALAEAGNLLMMAPRAVDNSDWMTFATALVDQGVATAKAAEAKDIQALLKTGGDMYTVCTGCHDKYIPMEEGNPPAQQ